MKLYPASVKRRFLSFVIDYIVLMILLSFLTYVIVVMEDLFNRTLLMTLIWIIAVLYILYFPICETFFNGKTIGKVFTNIQVVRSDGSPATGVECMQRFIFLPIDTVLSFGIIGLTTTMITKKRQRLGDIIADTIVVENGYYQKKDREMLSIFSDLTPVEQGIYTQAKAPNFHGNIDPLEAAEQYRSIQSGIATLRTHKARPAAIEYMESLLGYVHTKMFSHTSYTLKDIARFTLRSIPIAMYNARWSIMASLVLSIIACIVGIYSQIVDPSFANSILGRGYVEMTMQNIASGHPFDVYRSSPSDIMFFEIFLNNLGVDIKGYLFGIIIFIGPIFFILNNFVMVGCFLTLFAQHDLLLEALIGINQHGVFELSTIVIVMGAAIHFGVSVLFPGEKSRLKSLSRGARESMMIFLSTIPVTFTAAFIESYITRHVEWPLVVRLLVLIVSSLLIIGYYVVLPALSKRK